MNKRTRKLTKKVFKYSILTLFLTTACIPTAFKGVPALLLTTVTPTPSPDPRADLCNLLLSVGGTAADVQTCLTASGISDNDKKRLCSAAAGLSETEKATLRTELTKLGVDVNTCDVFSGTVEQGPPANSSAIPSSPQSSASTSSQFSPSPSPTQVFATPAPTATPSTGTGGGGTAGGFGGGVGQNGQTTPTPPNVDVTVDVTDVPPENVGVSGNGNTP
jgi:hypothetical protein